MKDTADIIIIALLLAMLALAYKGIFNLAVCRIFMLGYSIAIGMHGYADYSEYLESKKVFDYGCPDYNSLYGAWFFFILCMFLLASVIFPSLMLKTRNLIIRIEDYNRQLKLPKVKSDMSEHSKNSDVPRIE